MQRRSCLNLGFFRPDPAAEYHGVEAVRYVDWLNRILQSHDVVRGSSDARLGIGYLMRIQLKLATGYSLLSQKRATGL
uniref:Uncharacterized protein n=1 Tax=Kalanchoe fedtschenkoi TaxID=63787 RepID=A0A7N0UP26_KALFE